MLLGDYGAEIIKVEATGTGDGTRRWGPPWAGPDSAYFVSANRNKKSLTVNLKDPEGVKIIHQLAAKSDVIIENFKTGTLDRLGIGYEDLKAINPGIIFCSITGYGQTGPYKDRPGYDFVVQALGGIMSVTGPEEGGPYKVGVAISDITTGLFAATAILSAVNHRHVTGEGQFIDVSLLDTQVAWLANVAQNFLTSGSTPRRLGNGHPSIVPYQAFETADGHIAVGIGSDVQYRRFCELADCMPLWEDERYQSNSGRVVNRDELIPQLEHVFKTFSTDAWMNMLIQAKIPAGTINTIPETFADPQVIARDMLQTVEHPTAGPMKMIGPVAKMSGTPATIQSAPPMLGQHTDDILADLLGMSEDTRAELRERGVI
jgi:formyl-CoA transferase